MYLIRYLVEALNPKILNTTGFFSEYSTTQNTDVYDLIISHDLDLGLYDKLNYDGLYIFCALFDNVYDYEFIYYAGFYLLKKSNYLPYYLLNEVEKMKYDKHDPIIGRNFGGRFNIRPHYGPYEIVDHPSIIKELCIEYCIQSYLELGIRGSPISGLLKGIVPKICGVDIALNTNFEGDFYHMSTDQFFEQNQNKFDMVFIDACHNIDFVIRDVMNSIKILTNNGLILLHDTYPVTREMTSPSLCSNSYLIVGFLKTKCKKIELINLPISPGLCIIHGCAEFVYGNLDNYSATVAVRDVEMANPVVDLLSRKPKVLVGTGYPSFSKLVNDVIVSSEEEIVIFMSHRVRPKDGDITKLIELLNFGYGLVGLYRFAFFGFRKQLIRQIGFFDERYIGGGWEDLDFQLRLKEADIAYYEEESVPYVAGASTWLHNESPYVFAQKWYHNTDTHTIHRLLPEKNYGYDIGSNYATTFLPHRFSVTIPGGIAARYCENKIESS